MKAYSRTVALIIVLLLRAIPVAAQTGSDDFYRQWVDYRNGEISLDFDQTPVPFALHAIHAKTGFQILIPSPSETRMVNLRVQRQPLEPAIRALISTIGYKSFALLYDERGRPSRAVVLSAQPVTVKANEEPGKKDLGKSTLSAEEHEELQKELARWHELKTDERSRIESRLKELEPSDEREQLINEYGKQVLGLANNQAQSRTNSPGKRVVTP
jgi:hypothetical protein